MRVSIVIPTQRRPDGLSKAARSALAQVGVEAELELIVADNDAAPSAQAQVAALRADAAFPVIYVHEPQAGVANVRNAALRVARGDWIAFLDDDQEAPAGWLAALLATQRRLGADVVFGPVKARAQDAAPAHRPYLEWFFSREGPPGETLLDGYYGCGDSLLRRASLPGDQPFSSLRNHIGGEDDMLFGVMQKAGARFGWSPDGFVYEDPMPERQRLGYALARAFAYGQGPTSHCAAQTPPDRAGVARWMAIGLGQAAVFGLIGGVKWLLRAPDRALALDRAARGLGKTLWWGPFKIRFYGRQAAGEVDAYLILVALIVVLTVTLTGTVEPSLK